MCEYNGFPSILDIEQRLFVYDWVKIIYQYGFNDFYVFRSCSDSIINYFVYCDSRVRCSDPKKYYLIVVVFFLYELMYDVFKLTISGG